MMLNNKLWKIGARNSTSYAIATNVGDALRSYNGDAEDVTLVEVVSDVYGSYPLNQCMLVRASFRLGMTKRIYATFAAPDMAVITDMVVQHAKENELTLHSMTVVRFDS